jgi:hypothetical protein
MPTYSNMFSVVFTFVCIHWMNTSIELTMRVMHLCFSLLAMFKYDTIRIVISNETRDAHVFLDNEIYCSYIVHRTILLSNQRRTVYIFECINVLWFVWVLFTIEIEFFSNNSLTNTWSCLVLSPGDILGHLDLLNGRKHMETCQCLTNTLVRDMTNIRFSYIID